MLLEFPLTAAMAKGEEVVTAVELVVEFDDLRLLVLVMIDGATGFYLR